MTSPPEERESVAALSEERRLAAHMRALCEITPAMAHDLRAPINSMVFNLEILKETLGAAAGERHARYLRVLGEELSRLHRQLEIWLAQTAERTPETEDCDLRELVGDLVALLVPPARKRQVKVVWEPLALPAVVAARRATLKQALLLAGLAALDGTASGTSLALGVATGSGRTLVTLGSGPPAGPQESRFQLQAAPQASRTGLDVARLLVEESGGRLRIAGDPQRPDGLELEWPIPSR